MFRKRSVIGLLVFLIGAWLVAAAGSLRAAAPAQQPAASASAASPSTAPASPARPVVEKYCYGCHNQTRQTAGLALDTADAEHVGANAEVWERVIRKLRMGTMPPAGMPRPDQPTYRSVIAYMEAELDKAAAAH